MELISPSADPEGVKTEGAEIDILCGLSLMPSNDFLSASLPLFQSGRVDVLEWSFDMLWNGYQPPEWLSALLDHYSSEKRLLGHGVMFSLLSSKWTPEHDHWLRSFEKECATHHYSHISEHYGYSRAGSVIDSSPLPVPISNRSLRLGVERMLLLREKSGVPIGLENLGFAFGREDLFAQAEFVSRLLEEADGFLLLDLHNAYCQMTNFDVSAEEFFALYPLARVREIHISGGSVSRDSAGLPIRRDTHDDTVPQEVFDLLRQSLGYCPELKYVILERISDTIHTESDAAEYRNDFARIKSIVCEAALSKAEAGERNENKHHSPKIFSTLGPLPETSEEELAHFQELLLDTLLNFSTAEEARVALLSDASIQTFHSQISHWEPRMIELAALLTSKWAVLLD